MPKQDTYDVYDDHVTCHSKSGNTYLINHLLQCTCVGYGYRETCRHVDHVVSNGLLNAPVNGDSQTQSHIQDDIMHQLIHGSKQT